MGEIAIRAERLSKRYTLGIPLAGHGHHTLRDQITNGLRSLLRQTVHDAADPRTFWALKDVSFEVRRGEVLGIIGQNGAGKSTLLKILSRTTDPTSGFAEMNGRVSSLLEVGTGFHPELTGRENVYLNAAILGMRKAEIARKFDEIVDFSGVEKFIDTPVKRYSSGMYVRLAFAVAAHLEPEILIIDEVLAVGDASFQQKCLGKMEEVGKGGRTVLVVSHNLAMIEKMCQRAILLRQGSIATQGDARAVVETYAETSTSVSEISLLDRTDREGAGEIITTAVELFDRNGTPMPAGVSGRETLMRLHFKSTVDKTFHRCRVSISVHGRDGRAFFLLSTDLVDARQLDLAGEGFIDFIIPELPLSAGCYYLTSFIEGNKEIQDWVENAVIVTVIDGDFYGTGRNYPPGWQGATVLVKHRWELSERVPFSGLPYRRSDQQRLA